MPRFETGDRIVYSSNQKRSADDGWTLEFGEQFLVASFVNGHYMLDCIKACGSLRHGIQADSDVIDQHCDLMLTEGTTPHCSTYFPNLSRV